VVCRDTNLLPNALIGQAGIIARRDPAAALRATAAARSLRIRDAGDFPAFFHERMRRVRETCEACSAPTPSGLGPKGASRSTTRSRSRSGHHETAVADQ